MACTVPSIKVRTTGRGDGLTYGFINVRGVCDTFGYARVTAGEDQGCVLGTLEKG